MTRPHLHRALVAAWVLAWAFGVAMVLAVPRCGHVCPAPTLAVVAFVVGTVAILLDDVVG
ncbi:hypothetical protein [Halomarina rubra]|uniref:Uncharacterized protein n=1 Tax=Halomarina rubra TaxID=2071873 RepID=A0ABD6AYT5_9EURY|nr:hypothetical protein [Halomarina rubra]